MAGTPPPSHPSYFVMSPCEKNKDKGCEWKSLRGYLGSHIRNQCKYEEKLKCEFCPKKTPSNQLEAHKNWTPTQLEAHQNLTPTKDNWKEGCQNARVKCINCEDVIKR